MALVMAQAAGAGNVHFNRVEFDIGSLDLNAIMVGYGNDVAKVTLTGSGTVKAICQNYGGQQAPGRNPIQASVTQTDIFVTDSNGRALVNVTAEDPTLAYFQPSPTPKEAGCPNPTWEVVGIVEGSTDWTAARVVVEDRFGQVQIDLSYSCETFFENGVGVDIECQEN